MPDLLQILKEPEGGVPMYAKMECAFLWFQVFLPGDANLETTNNHVKPSLKVLRNAIESMETPGDKTQKRMWENNEEMMSDLSSLR